MSHQNFPQIWAEKVKSLLYTARDLIIPYLYVLASDRGKPWAAKEAIEETVRLFYSLRTIVDSALQEWETPPAETDECFGCPICDCD